MLKTVLSVIKYTAFFLVFTWGMAAGWAGVFPGNLIKLVHRDISAFLKGDPHESLTIGQQLSHDFGGTPYRQLRNFKPENEDVFAEKVLADTKERRENPRVFAAENGPDHYRLIVGAFDFNDAFFGALLISPTGDIVHSWQLNAQIEGLSELPDDRKNAYGTSVLPNGTIVANLSRNARGIFSRSFCSDLLWKKPGNFHHSAELNENADAFWTFEGEMSDLHPVLAKIDANTGETLREIDMEDVDLANAEISLLHMTRQGETVKEDNLFSHVTHPNDIEPLPSRFAAAFPMFEAGDLLINYRNLNLIFVVDPDTLKIKWWSYGVVDAAHDPDWLPNGQIVVFDNRFRSEQRGLPSYSRIVSIDPKTNQFSTLVEGEPHNFYSLYNGRQELTDDNTLLVTSSTQGRVFEIDLASGEVIFEFLNTYNWENGQMLHINEAITVDKNVAENWLKNDCKKGNI
ncbi:MAG: arylsulfotransferase family protein [Pseudomonadota bacterium]